jgi:hypothetical protein
MKTLFTVPIACEVYKPMIGKVKYSETEEGIPNKTNEEVRAEMGWKYTICSPLSPYALGFATWKKLCEIHDNLGKGGSLSDVFSAAINYNKNEITVALK